MFSHKGKRMAFSAKPTGRNVYNGNTMPNVRLEIRTQYLRGGIPYSEERRASLLSTYRKPNRKPWERVPQELAAQIDRQAAERFIDKLGIFS